MIVPIESKFVYQKKNTFFSIIYKITIIYNLIFLFFSYRYLLVDFGLAQQCSEYHAKNLETMTGINKGRTEMHSMKRKRSNEVIFYTNAIFV